MPVVRIEDPSDPRLVDYRDLTDVALRRRTEPAEGLYIAESAKVIGRAIAAGHRPRSVLVQEKWLSDAEALAPEAPIYLVDDDVADVVAGARLVLVLEDIVDHTNVGAAFRAAAGLGADAVLVTPRCADPLYRRSVRVSMGTVFQVPWTRIPEGIEGGWKAARDTLREAGLHVAALALSEDAVALDAFAAARPEQVALVLGAEGDGLSRNALASADTIVTIPMAGGVDSLNVAAAASVALWALRP